MTTRPPGAAPAAALSLALLVGLGSAPSAGRATEQEMLWWTTHGLAKVRPRDQPQPPGKIELQAARNEFEPFQLVLRAGRRPIEGVDVEVTDLVGPGSARIASTNATVYLQRYLPVRTPSSAEGGTGEWPDALVPRVDTYAGERRRAFPVTLEPGRNQPVWIDLYVPRSAAPGEYRGEAVVRVRGEQRIAAPIELRVLPFELPSTSSLANSYGFSGLSAVRQHRGSYTSDRDVLELTRVYTTALLRHRISTHGGSMTPPDWSASKNKVTLRWTGYEREVEPFLEGTVFGEDDPLPGARATSIDVRTPPSLPDEESKVRYWREWVRHFEQRGWLDRLFLYLWDEPERDAHYAQVLELGRLARRAAPELQVLLTEQLAPPLAEVVDIWVTLVNCIEPRARYDYCEETVARSAYRSLERSGRRLWWYQSCASHGCNVVGGDAFTGWPSLVIDVDPVANRVLPWLAFLYGVEGELYYNTVEAYNLEGSPWDGLLAHGGNGDGTLFYPGTPERVGGRTHIPIESLRLKLVREGLEDYEYLALLARRGDAELARREVARFADSVYRWDRRPEALLAARRRLAELLSARHDAGQGATR
ncbi:MAG TPA: glycoside hydrolase domain-containing protein [Thermoanaerobaculia bacterium]|nr:glycoside hydrolase domain-containing protein [Thermoanaerobaculia bacterium]